MDYKLGNCKLGEIHMTAKKENFTTFKKLLFAYLALSKIFYWVTNIMEMGPGGLDNLGRMFINRLMTRDLLLILSVIISFYLGKLAKNIFVYIGIFYVLILGLAFGQIWVIARFFGIDHGSVIGHMGYFHFFVQFTISFFAIGVIMGVKEYMAHVKKRTEAQADGLEGCDLANAPMGTRYKLAHVAKTEAQRFLHGRVMCTEHNLHEIIESFPKFLIEEADGMWCAAFVYYCCKKAGFEIPIKPSTCSCSFAGCIAWEEWAKADEKIIYAASGERDFMPAPGDIVLFDKVFIDKEHDHIGVVIENRDELIITAEGNVNNVSGIMERMKDSHIRAYIRLPDNYKYSEGEG